VSLPGPERRRPTRPARSSPVITNAAFVTGIGALVLLSLIPQMNWVFVIESGSRPNRPDNASTDLPRGPIVFDLFGRFAGGGSFYDVGTAFLAFSVVTAVLALVVLALSSSLPAETSDSLVTAGSGAALTWGVTAFFWILAFVWKAFTLWSKVSDRRYTGSSEPKVTVLPGIGLILGLLAALVVMAAFSYLLISRKRLPWLFTAIGLGFVLGFLLLLLNVKPWTIPGLDWRNPAVNSGENRQLGEW
jgi:hypothetical protein